jgi:starvation-inducible DNA-binding protein
MLEQITALGDQANGTVRVAAQTTSLAEYPIDIHTQSSHVDAVPKALSVLAKTVRAASKEAAEIGDDDTADMFTEISRATDKILWFVEAYVERNDGSGSINRPTVEITVNHGSNIFWPDAMTRRCQQNCNQYELMCRHLSVLY